MREILPKNEMRPQRDYSTGKGCRIRRLALLLAMALPACAQYPGRVETAKKPPPSVRAVAVLEWTGEIGKPSASRIIPISVFDGEQYQPGGLYLAKPEPLALEPGTEYILQDAGVSRGLFDVNTARDVDGYWFGYGAWKPMAPPPKRTKPKQGRNMPQVVTDGGDGRPHFKTRNSSSDSTSQSSSSGPDSSSGSNSPGGDPDRPTLRRRSSSSPSSSSSASTASANATAPETPLGSADPDRPHLEYGKQTPTDEYQAPELTGVPSSGLQQMIAVSDATDNAQHPFVYLWADPSDGPKMKEQMEIAAASAIAASEPPAKAKAKPRTTRTATGSVQHHKATTPPPGPPKPVFANEVFKAYELTYDGGATLVFSAETTDSAGKTKYVTLIAQPDFNGVPKVLFKSVTDDDHLDETPKMRLVDAVDARANNRGDLIFELRRRHDREFVIYRVAGGSAAQVFTTGSLSNSPSNSGS